MKNKIDLSTTVNVTSTFAGAYAGDLYVQSFKESDTIKNNAITVLTDIISSGHLPNLKYSGAWAARACGWNPQNTVDYTEKEIQTTQFQSQIELCKNDFRSTWETQKKNLFGNSEDIAPDLQSAILDVVLADFGQTLDSKIWTGTTASGYIDGLFSQFTADNTVIDATGLTSSGITSANVVAELEKVYALIPAAIENDKDLVWLVSSDIAKAYKQALANQHIGNLNGEKELDYLGIPMIRINGFGTKKMVVYRKQNIGLLTGVENELNEVRLIDTDETIGDGNVRISMRFNIGVGYSMGSEIVYYS